jgi:hypothetical protein
MPPRGAARRHIVRVSTFAAGVLAATCGAPRLTLPSGNATPFPGAVDAFTEAVQDCRGVKTLSASLSLSGRAGPTKLSARVDAGFADPGRLRLEGFPKINFGGKPFFILVANGSDATLVLTRDGRVLGGAPPAAIIEALTGIALEPDEMRALIAGCGVGNGQPSDGGSFEGGWVSVQAGTATVYLRQLDSHWRVGGARRGSLAIEYSEFAAGRPAAVHLRTTPSSGVAAADLTIRISQVETNATLDNAVFSVEVPKDATPLTLEELRRAGPLGGKEPEETKGTVHDHNEETKKRSTNGEDDALGPPSKYDSDGRRSERIVSSFVPRFRSFVVIRNRSLRPLRFLPLRPLRRT